MLTIDLIREARASIGSHIHRTPVLRSRTFDERAGCEVFFKCENMQRAGAFKIRGATNKILSLTPEERATYLGAPLPTPPPLPPDSPTTTSAP